VDFCRVGLESFARVLAVGLGALRVLRTARIAARILSAWGVTLGAALLHTLVGRALLRNAFGVGAGCFTPFALLHQLALLALELFAQFALALVVAALKFLHARVHVAAFAASFITPRHRRAVAIDGRTETFGAQAAGWLTTHLRTGAANIVTGTTIHRTFAWAALWLAAHLGSGAATLTVARSGSGAAFAIARSGFGVRGAVAAFRLNLVAAFAFAVWLVAFGRALLLRADRERGGA
jgi:hypothetical protein